MLEPEDDIGNNVTVDDGLLVDLLDKEEGEASGVDDTESLLDVVMDDKDSQLDEGFELVYIKLLSLLLFDKTRAVLVNVNEDDIL